MSVSLLDRSVIAQRLAAGVQPHDKREEMIRQLFADAGCQVSTQPVNQRGSNVICTLPGKSTSVVVVGAHYDFVRDSQGIVDDWTGTSLLPSLFQAVKDIARNHTFVFVAFAAEEEGLVGSRRYVKELNKEERSKVRAFVNLECLGLTTPKVWVTRSTPALVQLFLKIAYSIGVSVGGVSIDNVGDDDTHAFMDAKIPVISIHSITQEKLPILHSKADNLTAVAPELLYEAYRAVSFYLAYLDSQLP